MDFATAHNVIDPEDTNGLHTGKIEDCVECAQENARRAEETAYRAERAADRAEHVGPDADEYNLARWPGL